jgi:hypothetical protein
MMSRHICPHGVPRHHSRVGGGHPRSIEELLADFEDVAGRLIAAWPSEGTAQRNDG